MPALDVEVLGHVARRDEGLELLLAEGMDLVRASDAQPPTRRHASCEAFISLPSASQRGGGGTRRTGSGGA